MGTLLLATVMASTPHMIVDARPTVDLRGDAIRVGDIVSRAPLPLAVVEIARLPANRRSVTLSRPALAALVRRAVPAIGVDAGSPTSITFRRELPVSRPTVCFIAREAVAAGEGIERNMTRVGPCGQGKAPVRYDAAGDRIVATRAIAKDEFVTSVLLDRKQPEVTRGAALTLVSRSGPVTIERSVLALQPGRSGGRVFVQDAAGKAFAVPVAADAQ